MVFFFHFYYCTFQLEFIPSLFNQLTLKSKCPKAKMLMNGLKQDGTISVIYVTMTLYDNLNNNEVIN